MKTRPILFSGPMVRAILDGRKTQTRRVVKPQPTRISNDWDQLADPGETVIRSGWPCLLVESRGRNKRAAGILTPIEKRCPYGQPGDRLWVRETWTDKGTGEDCLFDYRADCPDPLSMKWRSSRFMPRWASRITLEVTGVRVERVQDISEGDAITEGVKRRHNVFHVSIQSSIDNPARRGFACLWDSINAKRGHGWDKNPWVWVVEFQRVMP